MDSRVGAQGGGGRKDSTGLSSFLRWILNFLCQKKRIHERDNHNY